MANDPTVKAGSWGPRTVEKIVRIQETAERLQIPLVYLVDSAGARITEQVAMFPGRRHAGHIFHMQVRLSGQVPQVCVLFGPSAAGGAYIPAFCDIVIMVEGNASMYLGSPRMAEVVVGEKVTLEEMGGARMHCTVSGCGDVLVADEDAGIIAARRYLELSAAVLARRTTGRARRATSPPGCEDITNVIPAEASKGYDVMAIVRGVIDDGSFFEIKRLFAREIVCGFARIDGHAVGVLASQPRFKGGVLFVDSADKATRFITCCDAFNVPLLFLADVPGFMIGTAVERQGIIRHGAKMISALAQAQVPRISVVLRKAYGAGLYAMSGPAFEPDCTLALPDGADRGDGSGGGDQRRLLQQDPGRRRRTSAPRTSRRCRTSTATTSTSSGSPPSSSSTRSCHPPSCAPSWSAVLPCTARDAAPTWRATIRFRRSERGAAIAGDQRRSRRVAAAASATWRSHCSSASRASASRFPGETMLITAAVFAATTHHLSIAGVIVAAIVGAVVGDNIGFGIGWFGGYPLLRRFGKYVRLDEAKLKVGRYIFMRHGAKVVFFGRFVSVLRTYAAFLAGTNRMHWSRFLDRQRRRRRSSGRPSTGWGRTRPRSVIAKLSTPVEIGFAALAVVVIVARRDLRASEHQAPRGSRGGSAPRSARGLRESRNRRAGAAPSARQNDGLATDAAGGSDPRGCGDQLGAPDEAVVVLPPGIAGDHGQLVAGGRTELGHLARRQVPALDDAVDEGLAGAALDGDRVADVELVDVLEVRLAMEGDDHVALLTRGWACPRNGPSSAS